MSCADVMAGHGVDVYALRGRATVMGVRAQTTVTVSPAPHPKAEPPQLLSPPPLLSCSVVLVPNAYTMVYDRAER
eukprot:COSAG01_NODE_1068_length_11878_cov_45.012395_3_plen_75_part_00